MAGKRLPKRGYDARRQDIEKCRTLWIRNDIWHNLKFYADHSGESMKQIVNKALYNYLMKEQIEIKTGMVSPFEETTFDTEKGTVRKDEQDTYIPEDI